TRWPRDWSSDVCSSDLPLLLFQLLPLESRLMVGRPAKFSPRERERERERKREKERERESDDFFQIAVNRWPHAAQTPIGASGPKIGRASCRERVQRTGD